MRNSASPTHIGLFVLSAMLLAIVAIFYLGGDGLSDKSTSFILYFEGDVKGLQVGAPVSLRGVKVGYVEEMRISFQRQSQSFEIPVIVKIDQSKLGFADKQDGAKGRLLLDSMIEQGLRGRLNIQSLVTGKMEVELDFHPETPVRLVSRSIDYPEIPTIPSSMEKIASALEGLPLERMVNRITEILDGIDKTLSATDIPSLATNLVTILQRLEQITTQLEKTTPELTSGTLALISDSRELIAELQQNFKPMINEWTLVATDSRRLVKDLDGELSNATRSMDKTLTSGGAAMQQLQKSAASIDSIIREDSLVMTELVYTLKELAAAARSIRNMADYLERHPDALLRGKQ